MVNNLVSIVGTILVLAIVTTLILPGRQTVGVIGAGGNALAANIRAAMGR